MEINKNQGFGFPPAAAGSNFFSFCLIKSPRISSGPSRISRNPPPASQILQLRESGSVFADPFAEQGLNFPGPSGPIFTLSGPAGHIFHFPGPAGLSPLFFGPCGAFLLIFRALRGLYPRLEPIRISRPGPQIQKKKRIPMEKMIPARPEPEKKSPCEDFFFTSLMP